MQKYDIAKFAGQKRKRRRGTTAQLPQIEGSRSAELKYVQVLRAYLRSLAQAVRDEVIPAVHRELETQARQRRITGDVDAAVFDRLRTLAGALGTAAANLVERILGLEAKRHTDIFLTRAKTSLGIDLSAVVKMEDLEAYLETVAARNVGLIKGLGDDTVKRIQVTITNALLQGRPVPDLVQDLKRDFEMSDNRAKLIAADQIGSLNSELNKARHKQAGIDKYVWRTARDERVRPRHRRLDGKVYSYDEPTGAEHGLPPGGPIRCRCIAQAIVEF